MSITDGGYCLETIGSSYANNLNCKVKALAANKLIVHTFDVESHYSCGWDWVHVKGNKYCGASGPNNLQLQTNDQLQFISDYTVRRPGFKICGYPYCANTDGSGLNPDSCLCGTSTCSDATGLYCQASSSTCFACRPGFALDKINLINLGGSGCTSGSPCGLCNGDCDKDGDCAGTLKCFQRSTSSEQVPGCNTGGAGDVATHDYCYGTASCSACASGKYQDELGLIAVTCKLCAGGKYNNLTTGVTACKLCGTGKSSSDSGLTLESQCQDCVAGKYNDLTGAVECKNCVAGSWSDGIGIASSALCKDCPAGKWSSTAGRNTSCISCSIGFFNPEVKRAQDCIACSNGKYQDQEETTACSPCAAGKNNLLYASTSEDACIDCPVGTYNDLAGHGDDCAQCAANAEAGLTTCSGCGPGEREREHSYFFTYFVLRLRNSDTNFFRVSPPHPPSFFFQRQIQRGSRNLCRLCTWEIFGHNGPYFMSFLP